MINFINCEKTIKKKWTTDPKIILKEFCSLIDSVVEFF